MNQSTDCWYCGVPCGGKSHPDIYACVKAVNEELFRKSLQVDAMRPVVEAVEGYFAATPPNDEGRWETMQRAVNAYQRKAEKRTEPSQGCKHQNTVVTEVDWCNDCGQAV